MTPGKLGKTHAEVSADGGNRRQKFIEYVEEFESNPACQRTTTVSGPMHSGLDCSRRLLVANDYTDGYAASHGLCCHNNIGQDLRFNKLVGEVSTRSSDATLDFIEDQ